MANTNLFYKLYSNSNNVAQSPFVCKSAIDEEDTSFDITTSSTGSAGVITDSNGNTLASIDMSKIHAAGITQYNVETKVLQPHSCCVIQGQEYGLSCASYYFMMPHAVTDVENYEEYVQCEFDIIYDNFNPFKLHIDALPKDGELFVDCINAHLSNYKLPIVASIQTQMDYFNKNEFEYLVFTSTEEGYFYYINNLKIVPLFQSEDYPDSPFSKEVNDLNLIVYDLIMKYHPVKEGEVYNSKTYDVDCDLYKWFLMFYKNAIENKDKFKKALDLLNTITPDMPEWQVDEILEEVNDLIKNTAYDLAIINNYDLVNMGLIYNTVDELANILNDIDTYYQDLYWLIEDRFKRVPMMKYPNGAFRGIVLIPDWPVNNSENYAHSSLWINHIKNEVKLYRPVKNGMFLPKVYGVLSCATILGEETHYRKFNSEFGDVDMNGMAMYQQIPNGWANKLNTNYMDPYRPQHSIYEDTMYMGQNCYANKESVIGLYRYMQYVDENKLWNLIGQAYMIIGNSDDKDTPIKNLPHSLLLYNPNPDPIRVKYIIFS